MDLDVTYEQTLYQMASGGIALGEGCMYLCRDLLALLLV
jgi:hypothetical protein